MSEIEKIKYAKTFIDKLANGINPLDDSVIAENEIVNNVRLSRCFFFVSDVLRQVIENGNSKKVKGKSIPFAMSQESLQNFVFSQTPIPVSEITKRINELITDQNMKKLSHKDITNWLIDIGMLVEERTDEGKTKKCPTESGLEMGISIETRTGKYNTYTVTLYNRGAQEFIIDNLEAVIALKYK